VTRVVRAMSRADIAGTSQMMARAFADDPLMTWILPDEPERLRRLPRFFAASMRGVLRHEGSELLTLRGFRPWDPGSRLTRRGGPRTPLSRDGRVPAGLAPGQQIAGCAIWLPPGRWLLSTWRQVAALPGYARALGSRLGVASMTYRALAEAHPAPPHWYLAGLGTDPSLQGTGVDSELMRSRLARCDAAGQAAYLESSNERNVPFYERHGFRVTARLTVPAGGPTLWLMWRDPQLEEAA
jgi:ribosomal protein S18 acetylase RimI-like enzyme